MTTTADADSFGEFRVDVVYERAVSRPAPSAAMSSKEQAAARLQLITRKRARDAAEEAEFILCFAELCPDAEDPPPDSPGARTTYWRSARSEFAGVSEFFVDELGAVLGVGRGTAAHKAARAFTWRDCLPATFTALKRGDLDERRAQVFADTLEHTDPALAGRVEAIVLPEAGELTFAALTRRILAVLLELDAAAAEEGRERAAEHADVFLEPDRDGMATLGARLPAAEAAEAYDLINTLAQQAKADGDPRPLGQVRHELYSL